MKVGIMQPYFFPYIGYFQLINAVDTFVIYDDVNFIKRGWINRNRILVDGKATYFIIPCKKVSQNKLISETEISFDLKERAKLLKTFYHAYHNAPNYDVIIQLIEQTINKEAKSIADLARKSIIMICDYLEIKTKIIHSSVIFNNHFLKKADRLIDICKKLNFNTYINPIGGVSIYTKEYFIDKGINLYFLESKPITYKQFDNQFVPNLSIIDVMMFNNKNQIRIFLNEYDLI
ncbi:MAG TPA: WbqC family protein [Thermodesulfobacteriota bacterium]|nr:WbqC family protein [Thermodesulfobacteriota bacterium]